MEELIDRSTESVVARARQLFDEHQTAIYRYTDRLFGVLMVCQWIAGILCALRVSPRAWSGTSSQIHLHVWVAVFLGGAISLLPVALTVLQPGGDATRYAVAVGQMLTSALLIHTSGGRIETHFHSKPVRSEALVAVLSRWAAHRVAPPVTAIAATSEVG
jgi:hypothetical protein